MKKSILMNVSTLIGAVIGATASGLRINGIFAEMQNESKRIISGWI